MKCPFCDDLEDKVVDSRMAKEGEIERQYKRLFMRNLPLGVSMDLPMSPQLETLIEATAARSF